MPEFWKISASADSGSAEVLVYDVIGGWDTDAGDFARTIDGLDVAELTVRINSPGGDAFDGIAMMNALRHHKAHVTCVVEGVAASAASVVALGGDRLVMRPGSELMIHDPWTFADGNAADLRKTMEQLDKLAGSYARLYADKAGGTPGHWRSLMEAETWYTAEEAVEAGLADAVEEAGRGAVLAPAARGRAKVFAHYKYAGRADAPRPVIPNREETSAVSLMNEVARRLGMVDAPDEKTVLAALDEALAEQTKETSEPVAVDDAAVDAAVDAGVDTGSGDDDSPDSSGEQAEPAGADGEASKPGAGSGSGDVPVASGDDLPASDGARETADTEPDDLTVTVDRTTLAELKEAAAYGMRARAREEAAARVAKVDAAIRDNKISASARDRWIAWMESDEETATAKLARTPKDTIPRSELGYSGGADEETTTIQTGENPFPPADV